MNIPSLLIAVVLGALTSDAARALTLSVGTGAGCDHATLHDAFVAIRTEPGEHHIHIRTETYATPNGTGYVPAVAQTGVFLEGGYTECTDAAPNGDPGAPVPVFDASGGAATHALDLRLDGLVGTFQLRRMEITGGDAFSGSDERNNVGGGLRVTGPASVLLGRGLVIRNNGAGRGGGVALVGGPVNSGSVIDKVDLYITEGAQVINNGAAAEGGGIYCGGATELGQPSVGRHGTIVFVDGIIGFNDAATGGGFDCHGSVEGGGGLQPRPAAGAAALVIGNNSRSQACGAGNATLDAALATDADGYRPLGAAENSNGLLAIVNNTGIHPGLCLSGSYQLGTTNHPLGASRFRLRNLYVAGQRGEGVNGLFLREGIQLRVQPSGRRTRCEFFNPLASCVMFEDNAFEAQSDPAISPASLVSAYGVDEPADLELVRATARGNMAHTAMLSQSGGLMAIESSVFDDNEVLPWPGSALGTSLFYAYNGGKIRVEHATVLTDAALDRFFYLQGSSTAVARAGIFASSVAPAPANVGGTAPPAQFTREWCGFFQSTADFASHTVVTDPTSGVFTTLPPGALQLDPLTLAPGDDLVDRCTPSVQHDYHGAGFGSLSYYPTDPPADIGAVENRDDVIFAYDHET
jgi:hypothetical protein